MESFEEGRKFLRNSFKATSGYFVIGLYAEGESTRGLLRAQLQELTSSFWRIPVSVEGLGILQTYLDTYTGAARPVAWLEQPDYSEPAWKEIFPRLNLSRDAIGQKLPLILVFSGPEDLYALFQGCATDLHSIASHLEVADAPEQRPVRETLRWLHLSDFHFKAKEEWKTRLPLQALLKKLAELKAEGLAPHLIFVTGDIANTGKPEEYRKALEFFTEVNRVLGLTRQHWFLVPGNHDVDRGLVTMTQSILLNYVRDATTLGVVMDDAKSMAMITSRLQAFLDFTGDFLGGARAWRLEEPWRADTIEVAGWRVGVMQLNKVWAGGLDGDKGRLYFSDRQVLGQLEVVTGSEVVFALCHHPLSYLADFDEQRSHSLLGPNAHFLLRGHLHRNDKRLLEERGCREFSAGAILESDPHYVGFMLGELKPSGGGRLHLFRYSDSGLGFWAKDTLFDRKAPDGVWEFPFEIVEPEGPQALGPDQTSHLAKRYRDAVSGYYGSLHFIGYARTAARTENSVEKLFVPLRLSSSQNKNGLTTAQLEEQLIQRDQIRLVILGDPGSGKSTLCRYLAVKLANRFNGPLPVLVAFREYMTTAHNESILSFILSHFEKELSVTIPKPLFETWLGQGQVVLFLDGMDEVGDPSLRVAMRDRIQAFSRAWPNTSAILTSRFAGYEEAPMGSPFIRVDLEKFSDEEQRIFVVRWYEAQDLPSDQSASERATLLLTGLQAAPTARELARNPLLATLLALVHYTQMTLPGQRAELYQLCVETLLVTWPARRNSIFEALDIHQQKKYLEEIAWWLQLARAEQGEKEDLLMGQAGSGNILIRIPRLTAFLTDRFSLDGLVAPELLAKNWLNYLERSSGILIEHRTGYFGFFHLSLLEYLAGRRLMNQEKQPAIFLVQKGLFDGWSEVCLLALGSDAQRRTLIDALMDEARKINDPKSWAFMLQAIREEVYFDQGQLLEILDRNASFIQNQSEIFLDQLRRWIEDIICFSKRHAGPTIAWKKERLKDFGLVLVQQIALWYRDQTSLEFLLGREDEQDVAFAYTSICFLAPSAKPFICRMDARIAMKWQQDISWDLELWYHFKALLLGYPIIGAALSLRHLHSMSWVLSQTQVGVQIFIKTNPFFLRPMCSVSAYDYPVYLGSGIRSQGNASTLARGFARIFWQEFSSDLSQDLAVDMAPDFERYMSLNSTRDFAQHLALNSAGYFTRDFARSFVRDFVGDSVRKTSRYFEQDFTGSFISFLGKGLLFCGEVTAEAGQSKEERTGLHQAPTQDRRDPKVWLLIQARNFYLSGIASHCQGLEDPSLFYLRHQAEMILLFWPDLERKWNIDHPYSLAHYLSLGVGQALITWRWPATERWATTITQKPEHWLPRAFYHQVHLLQALGDSPEHHAGYLAALEQGRLDPELPGYADAMPGPIEPAEPTVPTND